MKRLPKSLRWPLVLRLTSVVLIGFLLAPAPIPVASVQASSSPLLLTDGVDFPDPDTARVCVFLKEGIWGTPSQADFSLAGTIEYDGGLVSFELPVGEMEFVTNLASGNAYVVGYVALAPNPPPVFPYSAMACTQLWNHADHSIADGECGMFPCSL